MEELEKLKAEAYDCLVQVETWSNKLKQVNQKIAEAQAKELKSKE